MTKIQILGTGCPKCQLLTEHAKAAAERLGIEYTIEKVTDPNEIASFGVMMTPALAINGQVKIAGKVPDTENIKSLLTD